MVNKNINSFDLTEKSYRFILDNDKLPNYLDLYKLIFSTGINSEFIAKQKVDAVLNQLGFENISIFCENISSTGNNSYSLKKIKDGLDKFNSINGHYPTATEIDSCEYLPSSRTIQRSWGGLLKLRTLLGFSDVNFSAGKYRSNIASEIGKRGYDVEEELEQYLVSIFGEIFVHSQKRFHNLRLDFFIFSKTLNFGIDVFCFKDLPSLKGIITYKLKQYESVPFMMIILPYDDKLSKNELDTILSKKLTEIAPNCQVVDLISFKKWVSALIPHKLD